MRVRVRARVRYRSEPLWIEAEGVTVRSGEIRGDSGKWGEIGGDWRR